MQYIIIENKENSNALQQLEHTKRYLKLIIIDKSERWANTTNAINHIVEIKNIIRDTNPEHRGKGIKFVTVLHDISTCNECIKIREQKKEKIKSDALKNQLIKLIETKNYYESKIKQISKELKILAKLKKEFKGKYSKHPHDFIKIKEYNINLPNFFPLPVQIGDTNWIYNRYNNSFKFFKCIKFEKIESGSCLSNDEMRYETFYENQPIYEEIIPQPEIPLEYIKEYIKLLKIEMYNYRIREIREKFINNSCLFEKLWNNSNDGIKEQKLWKDDRDTQEKLNKINRMIQLANKY